MEKLILKHKFYKHKVTGKENLDTERFYDAISYYDEDFHVGTKLQIFHVDKDKYLPILEAEEASYVFVEKQGDTWVSVTEEEYEEFKNAHIEEYI